jgi:hypothetical protein
MENIKPGWFYVALDGDGIGKLVGRAIIANDVDELHKVSGRIDAAQDFILHWCESVDGIKISGGGDEATMAISPEAKDSLKKLRASIEESFGYTISVGVGRSLSEAGTALLVAKLRGKDRIVYFNKQIKEDIKKAKRRVRENRASQEEYKLSEAYLEKAENMGKVCDLHKKEHHKGHVHALHKHEEGEHNSASAKEEKLPSSPDNEDNRTDDCAYCQDLDAVENADGTAGMHDGCPACAEYDAQNGTTGGEDGCQMCAEYDAANGGNDGCPMCQEYDAANGTGDLENITESQAHNCNCPNCPKKDQSDLAAQDTGTDQSPDNCPECQQLYGDAVEEQPGQTGQDDPNLQGHETAEQVLGLLDQEPGTGMPPEEAAKKIDNTELPQGDAMKDNKSVPENFGDAQKNNISDSEISAQQSDHQCDCPDCPGSAPQQAAAQDPGQPQDPSQDQPDMSEVLQGGLDDHANEQKKQQVLDMVGQTLAGFKANKASLEATKEQNQPLYNSCIQMLKSMISLCDLLGLRPKPTVAPQPALGAPAPAAPGGAPQEGSSDPKAMG